VFGYRGIASKISCLVEQCGQYLAPAVRHGCRSAGHACPLGSSTAAGSSVRHNQGLKARPHAVNLVALARKRFIAHF
jgi:hypothetical protein